MKVNMKIQSENVDEDKMPILVALIRLLKVFCRLIINRNKETTKTPGDYVIRIFDKKICRQSFC